MHCVRGKEVCVWGNARCGMGWDEEEEEGGAYAPMTWQTLTGCGSCIEPPITPSRRRDFHSMAPPRVFARYINADKQGVSSK